jgi:hypothetical protein
MRGQHDLSAPVLPDEPWGDPLSSQVAVDRIMTELLAVVRKVRQRVVGLADQQLLTVIETGHRVFHPADSTAFSRIWRPSKSLLRMSYCVDVHA